jgi:hypothetical protein
MKNDPSFASTAGRRRLGLSWLCAALMVAPLIVPSTASATGAADGGQQTDFLNQCRLSVIGLTADQRLVKFRACNPARTKGIGSVSGLSPADTALVGIDFRVQDGKLYGVGNGGGIYTIDPNTAQATLVSQLSVALDGTSFGVDFNPAADRLRIISDTGQNLRHNVNAGGVTLTDGTLNYPAPVNINPATGLTGAAYTNNDLDANTGTTLFDIDASLNQVAIQSPPNPGSLVPTGKLTVDPDAPVGFDIYTTLRNGVAVDNSAYASLVVNSVSGFYRVNLLTGQATLVRNFKYDTVIDIAVPLNQ